MSVRSRASLKRWRLGVVCMCVAGACLAQARLQISDIDVNNVPTPGFRVRSHPRASVEREWAQIFIEYETAARGGWLDELTLNVTVIIRRESGRPLLLRGSVTYMDIEDGSHHAALYIRPGFLERHYGDDKLRSSDAGVRVEAVAMSRQLDVETVARMSLPRGWHEAGDSHVEVFEGELLPRTDTPFAPLDYDFYEHIKPEEQN